MARFHLRTLGGVALDGPAGPVSLDEPRLVALLAMLAIAGDAGMSGDELLLRLTPEATAEHGRVELARLVAVLRLRLGGEASVVTTATGHAVRRGLVACDVRTLAHDAPVACAEFLAGVTVTGSPEFREWLAEMRHRVEPVPVKRHVLATPRSRRVAALWASLVMVGAAVAYLAIPRGAPEVAISEPLLLSDLSNQTGDTVFDVGLVTAAAIRIQEWEHVRLYPRTRLPDVYRRMQITNLDTALTVELATDVAQRDGVRFVLGLQIDRSGDRYRVTGRLVDVSSRDRVRVHTAAARSRADVLAALDDVLFAMRAVLGESRWHIEARRVPLPYVTTASLEALRSYGDGAVAWSRGDYRLARELWHRAVDIDTGFAMAYGALGRWYYFNHDRPQGERYFGDAFTRIGRLTTREQLALRESAASFRGQGDSAAIFSGQLAGRYPGVTTWYNYGTELMRQGRDAEAVAALKTALRYDSSHVSSYVNLATIARRDNRLDDALAYYASAGRRDSTVLYRNSINAEWGGTFVRAGRYAEAESAFTRMATAVRTGDRAFGLRSLGYLALWRGRGDAAAGYFQGATAASVQAHRVLSELRNRMLLATAYRSMNRDREANVEVTRALELMHAPVVEPAVLAMVATICIKLGRVGDARAVWPVLRGRANPRRAVDVASKAYVGGLLALAAHRPDSALFYARAAHALPSTIHRLTLEVEAYRQLGALDSARVSILRILDADGFGIEGEDDWLRAPLVLGDVLLAQHDTAGAVRAYERMLDHRRAASPAPAAVAEARRRLAPLRGASAERRPE